MIAYGEGVMAGYKFGALDDEDDAPYESLCYKH